MLKCAVDVHVAHASVTVICDITEVGPMVRVHHASLPGVLWFLAKVCHLHVFVSVTTLTVFVNPNFKIIAARLPVLDLLAHFYYDEVLHAVDTDTYFR